MTIQVNLGSRTKGSQKLGFPPPTLHLGGVVQNVTSLVTLFSAQSSPSVALKQDSSGANSKLFSFVFQLSLLRLIPSF